MVQRLLLIACVLAAGGLTASAQTAQYFLEPHAPAPPPVDVPAGFAGVLEAAASRAELLANSLQRITARETIEHAVVDRNSELPRSEVRRFNYLVTINQLPESRLSVTEDRNGDGPSRGFISGMSTAGLPVMALIFHPLYSADYEMHCEGRGESQGQSAWIVSFHDRPDRDNFFLRYVTPQGVVPAKLRGRAWISAESGDILKVETDLTEPIPAADLIRSHLTVEYAPQKLDGSAEPLWLPVKADLLSEFKGRRCHIRHSFSDFHLFSVQTRETFTLP